MLAIFLVAGQLAASQEGFSSLELISIQFYEEFARHTWCVLVRQTFQYQAETAMGDVSIHYKSALVRSATSWKIMQPFYEHSLINFCHSHSSPSR
jgi:hypothetical protein